MANWKTLDTAQVDESQTVALKMAQDPQNYPDWLGYELGIIRQDGVLVTTMRDNNGEPFDLTFDEAAIHKIEWCELPPLE